MKQLFGRLPLVGGFISRTAKMIRAGRASQRFRDSASYWDERYATGGNSGRGSYGEFAKFKAKVLNDFVESRNVESVVEFGCGDGNQLFLARYPSYVGFDVSSTVLALCRERFADDHTKRFARMQDYAGETADLSLSLDVIYHLVEDDVYEQYMIRLFQAARRFVAIYSSNEEPAETNTSPHVRHRRITDWIASHQSEWGLLERVNNPYPWNDETGTGSFADFYFYQRKAGGPSDR